MTELTPAQIFEGCIIMKPKYLTLWNLIDTFDKKHLQSNYPYQTDEVKQILRITFGLLSDTKETPVNKPYLEKIRTLCSKINIDNPDYLQINELKDLIHHLYEYGFPNKNI